MKSLKQLCIPRQSVFDTQKRDTVLDINDLVKDEIDVPAFFDENYVTDGMKTLLEHGFRRLEGKSPQGVFRLKQAMGGGKTHNLLTLGLLAKHPEFRQQVMGKIYKTDPSLGTVKVVAFSGRESDAPFGIWGEIAEQLGKKEHFKDLYSPMRAPGQTAWETLLAGETVLILLDELPPYFENAKSVQVGNSDLAQVTATALSNLLVAVGRESCARVCLVITDLVASYEQGGQQIADVLKNFEKETHRSAMNLEPVRMTSDELYHILRKRLFEKTPELGPVTDVAQGYAQAVREAKQMDITNESPERFATRIEASYPFHPAIRDLYARFRENQGFQQTRGLIRLMRIIVSRMWNSGEADKRFLVSAHDLDFNDRETRAELAQINSTLENAIAHDIASDGSAVAEIMDISLGSSDARDTCRLLYMASLANVPNAVIGLSLPELIANLAEPGRDLARLKSDVLEKLATAAWYLHSDRDGKLFFKNTQNLNAKLESLVRAYLPEQAVKELRTHLAGLFKPENGWCYQQVLALPALDEVELDQERVTLIITEPYAGSGLSPEIKAFFENATYKNRVAFLTGSRNTYNDLLDTGKRLKAIQQILDDLRKDKLPDSDPQMVTAQDLSDKIRGNFHSAVRETFTTLWYPIDDAGVSSLSKADFSMKFESNRYNGEQQIVALLKEKSKFEENITGEIFRKKCEQRLFTIQNMPWGEIKKRAGMLPKWQWHHPQALDDLKRDCLQKDIWRENGGYVDKGPFPQPKTSVVVREVLRDDDTGEVTLNLSAVHGDVIYYDFGAAATTASAKLDGGTLKTNQMRVSFLAVDSSGEHETGEAVFWQNRITIKHKIFDSGPNKKMKLQAAPDSVIRYTTDGSDPKVAGATYDGEFVLPFGAPFVLAYAERDEIGSTVERLALHWDKQDQVQVDAKRPATWQHKFAHNSTKDSYVFLELAHKHRAQLVCPQVTITGEAGNKDWIEFTSSGQKIISPDVLEELLTILRKTQASGQVQLSVDALGFELGQDLLDWVEEAQLTLVVGEIKQ